MITWKRALAVSAVLAVINGLENAEVALQNFQAGRQQGHDDIIENGSYVPYGYCHQQDRLFANSMRTALDDFAKAIDAQIIYQTVETIGLLEGNNGALSYGFTDMAVGVQAIIRELEFETGDLTPENAAQTALGLYNFSDATELAEIFAYDSGCAMSLSANFTNTGLEPAVKLMQSVVTEIVENPDKHPTFSDESRRLYKETLPGYEALVGKPFRARPGMEL